MMAAVISIRQCPTCGARQVKNTGKERFQPGADGIGGQQLPGILFQIVVNILFEGFPGELYFSVIRLQLFVHGTVFHARPGIVERRTAGKKSLGKNLHGEITGQLLAFRFSGKEGANLALELVELFCKFDFLFGKLE